jgi:hypothetical protein
VQCRRGWESRCLWPQGIQRITSLLALINIIVTTLIITMIISIFCPKRNLFLGQKNEGTKIDLGSAATTLHS